MKDGKQQMPKWRTIRIRQELAVAAKRTLETSQYRSLSEFVSEAIQLRLDELKQSHKDIAGKHAEYTVIHERLLYTPNHMWAIVTPEGNIRVGASHYAQTHLKGITNIQIKPVGSKVDGDKPFGFVETWMFKFDLHAPVSGKIAKINKTLQDKPAIINEDPYEAGWIAEIEPNNIVTLEEELRDLMGPTQYKTWAIKQQYFAGTKT